MSAREHRRDDHAGHHRPGATRPDPVAAPLGSGPLGAGPLDPRLPGARSPGADPVPEELPLWMAARDRRRRTERGRAEGEPTLPQLAARVGTLGWLVVVPALAFGWLGRLVDEALGTGIFMTAPMLLAGIALGCWTGWKWMHRR